MFCFGMIRWFMLSILMGTAGNGVYACTSAIVSGRLTESGRPILWKHRDASDLNNKVEKIEAADGRFAYVGLFNGSDSDCREVWIGFNSEGFAVMNTASYNLKNDTVSVMDREGFLMAEALATCRTVDDFARMLELLPKPLGVEANFGVIDAIGNAAYFETNNWEYVRFDVSDSDEGYLIRTNYSCSGRKCEGYGYVREQNAEYLLAPYVAEKKIVPAVFTEELSRSFYHSLIEKDFSSVPEEWVVDKDFIPRYTSSASVAIEGVLLDEDPSLTTMWTVLGYPPCGIVEPVWIWSVPEELRAEKDGFAPACDRANQLKQHVFPIKQDRGEAYLNIRALYNDMGTGICQRNRKEGLKNYEEGYRKLDLKRKEMAK